MELQFKYLCSFKEKTYILNSFSEIFYNSFNQKYTKQVFFWKYLSPQTEESIIQQILVDEKTIGFRGLWKIYNYPNAYKCIDTCTLPNYQGKGIFKLSNQNLIKEIGSFYNYPNQKSKPGYLKSGWDELSKMDIYLNKLRKIGLKFVYLGFTRSEKINKTKVDYINLFKSGFASKIKKSWLVEDEHDQFFETGIFK